MSPSIPTMNNQYANNEAVCEGDCAGNTCDTSHTCPICIAEKLKGDRMVQLCANSAKHSICVDCFQGMLSKFSYQMKCPECRGAVKAELLPLPANVLGLPIRDLPPIPLFGEHTVYYFYFDGTTIYDHQFNPIEIDNYHMTIDDIRAYYNSPRMITNIHNGQKNGLTTVFDIYGRVTERIMYCRDRVHGTYKVYENGSLIESSEYFEGELHGLSTVYYTDYEPVNRLPGNMPPAEMVIRYHHGKQTGDIYTYHENGHPDEVFPNTDATIRQGFNGTYKCFYPTGKIKIEIEYEDNIPHGPYAIYSRGGSILESGAFNQGRIEGEVYSRLTATVEMIQRASADLVNPTNPEIATMANAELYIRKVVKTNSAKKYNITIHDISLQESIRGMVTGDDETFTGPVNIETEKGAHSTSFRTGVCISTGV